MFVQPKPYSYAEFPASTAAAEGMETLKLPPAPVCFMRENIVYAEKNGQPLHLQLLTPLAPEGKKPLIVYVQGSAWFQQMLFMNVPQLARFAARGYAVAMVEYRPSTVAPFPAQIEDTKSAIRYLIQNAEELGLDAERLVLWGDSSGGHTVTMAGFTGDAALTEPEHAGIPIRPCCIIDYYGPTDVSKMNEQPSTQDHIEPDSPEGWMLGHVNVLENPDRVRPTVPMHYVTPERPLPPILIVHGDKDRLVPFQQSVLLYEKLRACGKTARLIKLAGADHGSGEFWAEPLLDVVEAFIQQSFAAR